MQKDPQSQYKHYSICWLALLFAEVRAVIYYLMHESVLLHVGLHTGAHLAVCLEAQGRCLPSSL